VFLKKNHSSALFQCIRGKLKRIVSSAYNKKYGENFFINKQLELAPFASVEFDNWNSWEQDPFKNRSWQWRLHWFSFLPYLMAYHGASNDDAVLDFACEAIQSWLDSYLKTDVNYPFEFIWHDHATALRAEQFVLFACYCRTQAPDWTKRHDAFLTCLEQALIVHGQRLAQDDFYSEHTNHGLEQVRVLLLLGTVFEGEHAHTWQQIAIRRIRSELTFSFTDEGVHVENSPAYHVFVFKVFLGIIEDYPEEVLGDLVTSFSQLSAKALSFITHILRPDGTLPPIGDTEQLPTSDAYQIAFGHTREYKNFLYAVTQGKEGDVPRTLNRVYPQSGYAIFRDYWPAAEQYKKAFHIIVKVGCSSRYHHQQDEGHISLYAGGEDWLIDSGLYNYINHDPMRKYMRSRLGHNVPVISHTSYAKEFEHRLGAWQVSDYSETAPRPYLAMKLNMLLPVQHERRVSFDADAKIMEVTDAFSADDEQQRNIILQWHFPQDKTLTIGDKLVIVSSRTGSRVIIEFLEEEPAGLHIVTGSRKDRIFSCISYKANQVEPSQLLRVVCKESSTLKIVTRFTFIMAPDKLVP